MRQMRIQRTSFLIVRLIGLVAVLVFGAGWFHTNSHAQSQKSEIKSGNSVLRTTKVGSSGFLNFIQPLGEKGVRYGRYARRDNPFTKSCGSSPEPRLARNFT